MFHSRMPVYRSRLRPGRFSEKLGTIPYVANVYTNYVVSPWTLAATIDDLKLEPSQQLKVLRRLEIVAIAVPPLEAPCCSLHPR